MRLTINGQIEHSSAQTLAELVREQGLPEQSLIIEYNGGIIQQHQWESQALQEGDRLELLSFVGGG